MRERSCGQVKRLVALICSLSGANAFVVSWSPAWQRARATATSTPHAHIGLIARVGDGIDASLRQKCALLEWARGNGAWISEKIVLQPTPYGGRSFYAREQIQLGEDVACLPTSPDFVLTQASVRQDTLVGEAIKRWELVHESLESEDILALYLAAVKLGRVQTSPWRAYIEALPTDTPQVPMLWENDMIGLLPDARPAREGKLKLKESKSRCLALLASICPIDATDGDSTGAWIEEESAVEWALCMLRSRALREVTSLAVSGGGGGGGVLPKKVKDRFCYPVADLFDHASSPLPTPYIRLRQNHSECATASEISHWRRGGPRLYTVIDESTSTAAASATPATATGATAKTQSTLKFRAMYSIEAGQVRLQFLLFFPLSFSLS